MSLDRYIQDGQDPKVVDKIVNKISDMLTHNEVISYIAMQKKPAVTLLPDSITISNKRIFLCEFTKLGLTTNFEIFFWKDIKDIAFKEEIFGSKVTVIPFTGENLSIDYIPKSQARKLYQLIKEALQASKETEEDNYQAAPVAAAPKPIIPIRDIYEKPKEAPVDIEPVYTEPVAPVQQFQKEEEIELIEEEPVQETPYQETPKYVQQDHTFHKNSEPVIEIKHSEPTFTAAATPTVEDDDEITIKLKKLKNLFDRQLISQAEYENKKAEILSQL